MFVFNFILMQGGKIECGGKVRTVTMIVFFATLVAV